MGEKKKFYGYKVMGLLALQCFMVYFVVGVYGSTMSAIMERLSIDMVVFSSFTTVYLITCVVTSFFGSVVYKKIGPKNCILLWALGVAAQVLSVTYCNSVPVIYACMVFYGFALGVGYRAGISMLAESWFIDRRDEMIGYVSGVMNFGAAASMFLIGSLMSVMDLGVLIAVVVGVCMLIVIVCYIMIKTPAQMGQKPFEYPEGDPRKEIAAKADASEEGVDLSVVLRSPAFYLLLLSIAAFGLFQCPGSYLSVVMVGAGVSSNVAAILFGVQMLAQCVISLIIGKIFVRIKHLGYGILCTVLFAAAFTCMWSFYQGASGNFMALLTAFLVGCGSGAQGLMGAYMAPKFFGMKTYATVMTIATNIVFIGNAMITFTISPIVTADGGSWERATMICIWGCIASGVLLGLAAITAPMRKKKKSAA